MTVGDLFPDAVCIEADYESQEYIAHTFAELSEANQKILSLVMDGKTQAEISKALGVNIRR